MIGKHTDFNHSFVAGGTIAKDTIVKFGADADTVVVGAAATDKLIGVALEAVVVGERVEVQMNGVAEIKLGGTVAFGDDVTSGAAGVGVKLTAAVTIKSSIGRAMGGGVTGDIISVEIGKWSAVTA